MPPRLTLHNPYQAPVVNSTDWVMTLRDFSVGSECCSPLGLSDFRFMARLQSLLCTKHLSGLNDSDEVV